MKVTVVTGASKGIGREVAVQFAALGHKVIIADKDAEEGLKVQSLITSSVGSCLFIQTDISLPDEVDLMIRKVREEFNRIDILINNAGFGIWKSPYDLSVEEWDSVLDTNLRGAFLCSRAAAAVMRETGGGSVINIASTRALMSEENSEAYAASKGGILALTHAMAASFANDRIRVNCISPGWIETRDYQKLRNADHEQHLSKRVGKPSDIAAACVFLSENDFINGENIVIDGGMTRKMIYEP